MTNITGFLSNGGLLKMMSIIVFSAISLMVAYKVIIVGSGEPLYNQLLIGILTVLANTLGFTFGHSSALQGVSAGTSQTQATQAATVKDVSSGK